MKQRQDAWSEEDDLLLAETVLRHIREGSTQLNAFEEVGDRLNRTSAACGFRWNAVVRNDYQKAIAVAKKQRKQRQRTLNQKTKPLYTPPAPSIDIEDVVIETAQQQHQHYSQVPIPNLDMQTVISFLTDLDSNDGSHESLKEENNLLKAEVQSLAEEKQQLAKEIEQKEQEFHTIQEDYQSLVQIMDRARRMVLFNDNEQTPTNSFKMDRNGNLERVAK